jgi:hypothetical protein
MLDIVVMGTKREKNMEVFMLGGRWTFWARSVNMTVSN